MNGQFVIVNYYNSASLIGATFLYSTDGVHWTRATASEAPQFNVYSITHGGGKYVAGTSHGQMITSENGISWTSAVKHMGVVNQLQYINGHFVAVGFGDEVSPGHGKSTILTSVNGVTWQKTPMGNLTSSMAAALNSIASDGQTIVTGGFTGVYRLAADNLNQPNLTTQKVDGFDYNYSINNMVYTQNDGGLFIIVGSNGNIRTSPDSFTWTNESINGANAEFNDVIEAGNSVVAVGSIGVYKRLGQEMDSELTPNSGSFDKNIDQQADVTTTITLKGNTLFNIFENSSKLKVDRDYTISAAGDEVVLKKEYLAKLPVGTATLTFKFTGGADQTFGITVTDSTPMNSGLNPTQANFDKNISAQSDITTTMSLHGNTLSDITNDGEELELDTDYTVLGNTVTIKKEYLAQLPVGAAILMFEFNAGADVAMVIMINDTTPQNSAISPTIASFDKNASAQSDVTATLTLNGNTIFNIFTDNYKLQLNKDYTISASGDEVVLKKEYLATLPVGTATLTFKFTGGADQTMVITISDSKPNNSTINPTTASFDKNASAQSDVTATLTLNGNTVFNIFADNYKLQLNKDYTISASGDEVVLKKEYLATLPVGTATLTFKFTDGADQSMTITVSDTTPQNSAVSPATASFDKNASAQSDITAALTLNGNRFFNIYKDSRKLRLDTDYTVSAAGDEIVLKKEYLATLPVGTATLSFTFTRGADQSMVITISDSTSYDSAVSPTTGKFDKHIEEQVDVTTTITLNGNTLFNIFEDNYKLQLDKDYTISAAGDEVVLKKEYLATLPVGTATLTFKFTGGADQSMTITVSDTMPQNSAVSPATASFDKNASGQSDITAALTLNGNRFFNIYKDSRKLRLDTDYTVSAAGDEIVLKKEYLATLPVGTATLTFKFTDGDDQSMTITISDSTSYDSAVSPTTGKFDKHIEEQVDVTTTITLNGNTLFNIFEGNYKLQLETDYTISAAGDEVILKKAYLATLPVGTTTLTFKFSGGNDQLMVITVSDSTSNDSAVSPATASFDKNASAQSDITAALTLNGNTFFNIFEGNYKLQLDKDYTISVAGDEVILKKEYLATLLVGTVTLTFKFTGGADQMMVVTVSDSTSNDSAVSPATASFDKNASAQSDVTASLTLNGNTIFNIFADNYKLQLNKDYTISASGDEVVLKKEYLATLPVGTASLTFKFTGGADQTMVITVSDSTQNNSAVSPTTASFDKEASVQSNVTTTLTLNGNMLDDITYNGQALALDTDYTVSGNTVTIKKEYLATLPVGTAILTFQFSAGTDQALTITVSDSTPNNSTISPSAASFDKKAYAQADVSTTLTLNGNELTRITHGGQELELDTDYTVTGNTVTIKKDYLAVQLNGIATLVFQFSAGSDHALTITISDSTPSNSEINPPTATFDKKTSAQKDVAATLTLNGNTLSGIEQGAKALELTKDYTVSGDTVTIKKSFLAALPVGTTTLTFQFSAGSDQTMTISIVNTTPSSPPSSGGNEPAQPEPNNAANIYVNGQVISAGTAKEGTRNNQSVLTIIVDQDKLAERLASEGQNPVITIQMSSKSDISVGQLTGSMVKDMENRNATLELKTDKASYFLPAGQIDIDSIQRQLGSSVSLQDVIIHIEMAVPVQAMGSVVENAAKQGEFTIVAAPIDFTVSASYQDRTVEVTQFNVYVQRQIALPEGILRGGITTGIIVDPDGSVRHVPTKVILVNGQYFAQINSLTNSTYAVVWHPVEFADVAGHWAKDAINDMGSRMIVDGKGNGSFQPNQEMTRAEFAAILVRGLGLKPVSGQAPFSDVNQKDWYQSAVATAYEYQLISGFEDGTFRPNDKLTRQQAIVMIAKAMKLTQLKEKLPEQATDELLRTFGLSDMSEWAKQSIADCIQAGIVVGKSGSELALQASITRAEVAVMIQRLLENSDLI
ncbi:X2-like carbohydrate binding domain-containing protein [Paenibacillus sp. NPDC057967]|uniref:X2-like carbohydrate binding domain-containing protein n=1 Tax=Paenibacillus sp. NPDC057967 TaxID=3346293 RepID=UPI0036DEF315